MCLGFALGAVGLDKMTGTLRMTFGHEQLLVGFDFLIAVIGLFGIGEILSSMESGLKFSGTHAKIRLDAVLQTWKKLLQLLGDLDPQLHRRLLDGHHAGRRDAGLLHELRPRQALLQARRQFRQGRDRGRGGAGDGRARRRHQRAAADADARHSRLADGGRAARRPDDLGPAARTDAVHRAEGLRLGPDRLHVSRQHRRPDRRAHLRAAVRRHPARAVLDHRARSSSSSARSAPTPCTTPCSTCG